jgi:hypothetical protein
MIYTGIKVENRCVISNLKAPFQSEEPKGDSLAVFITCNEFLLLNIKILQKKCEVQIGKDIV